MSAADQELLAAYDQQLRGRGSGLPPELLVERDGPLLRIVGMEPRGFIGYRDLGGLDGPELDQLIARQRDYFAARGEGVEWKLHGHDQPLDLADHLERAGFLPENQETVMIASVSAIAAEPGLPSGVSLREAAGEEDLQAIARLHSEVWGEDSSYLARSLAAEKQAWPEALLIVLAEAGEAREHVCDGWVRFEAETEFATLWGGSTLPGWRGRGIYRALVAWRAREAQRRGYRYLEVDASDASRPILERLGFRPVTTTTPYVWSPT